MENIRHKIVFVDDSATNLTHGRSILRTFYEVYPALSAEKLFNILEKLTPDLILLDIFMPEMDGYDTMQKLKSDARYKEIPVIFLTAVRDEESQEKGFDLGAVDYICKPFSAPLLIKRIENQMSIVRKTRELMAIQEALQVYADNLEMTVREKTDKVIKLQNAVLTTVSDLVEFRDKFTGGHIYRTQHYLRALVNELFRGGIYIEETCRWDMDFFLQSAQLHDVGKIAISDLILRKPGKLTPEEYDIMKTHVTVGVNAIEKIMNDTEEHSFLQHALLIAGTHHEKWDGSGYPLGLKGKNIPLEGRLMAIADVYDALISDRPYKKALPHREACGIIEAGSGTHFDPVLVEVFKRIEGEFERISKTSKNRGEDSSVEHY